MEKVDLIENLKFVEINTEEHRGALVNSRDEDPDGSSKVDNGSLPGLLTLEDDREDEWSNK